MEHIQGFGLENFRVFKDKTHFDFAPLTILTGTNNSGKSTVINALQLLKENFKDYKVEQELYKNIDNILLSDFDVHALIKRYGNLDQFISKDGDKSWFAFSFMQNMKGFDDEMEVICRVRIHDNRLKNGNIVEINVVSKESKETIFNITELKKIGKMSNIDYGDTMDDDHQRSSGKDYIDWRTRESIKEYYKLEHKYSSNAENIYPHVIRLNLLYFYNKYKLSIEKNIEYHLDRVELDGRLLEYNEQKIAKRLVQNTIEHFNKKYDTNYKIRHRMDKKAYLTGTKPRFEIDINNWEKGPIDKFLEMKEEFEEIGMYDFSSLWEKNKQIKQKFDGLLSSFYPNDSIKQSMKKFQYDLLKFLTDIEWKNNLVASSSNPRDLISRYIFDNSEVCARKGEDSDKLFMNALSWERFLNSYTNIVTYLNDVNLWSAKWPGNLSIDEDNLTNAINNNRPFYERLLTPILELMFQSLELVKEYYPKQYAESEYVYGWYLPSERKITLAERTIYDLIIKNIQIIPEWFNNLKQINFLSTNRNIPQRIYSLGDNNEFSNLMKILYTVEKKYQAEIFSFINKCVKAIGLGDSLYIEPIKGTGEFKVYIKKGPDKTLLADMGYGSLQILPVILRLIPDTHNYLGGVLNIPKSIIIIEEPETNMHPALQSKLADIFIEAIRFFEVQLIIETHSEYLIRKLQYLTAKKEIDPELTQIYYFYHPDKVPPGEKQVVKIDINEDGSLSNDFGTGFFDEADKIAMSVWSLNQSRKN